jgi:hypothetical protein
VLVGHPEFGNGGREVVADRTDREGGPLGDFSTGLLVAARLRTSASRGVSNEAPPPMAYSRRRGRPHASCARLPTQLPPCGHRSQPDLAIVFRLSKINGPDPYGMTVWASDTSPPFEALSNPVVQLTCRRPGGGLNGDRWLHLPSFLRVSVAVLIEHNVQVCCPLLRLVPVWTW